MKINFKKLHIYSKNHSVKALQEQKEKWKKLHFKIFTLWVCTHICVSTCLSAETQGQHSVSSSIGPHWALNSQSLLSQPTSKLKRLSCICLVPTPPYPTALESQIWNCLAWTWEQELQTRVFIPCSRHFMELNHLPAPTVYFKISE